MALEDALARVPGLAGYLGQEQFTQQRQAGDLANLQRAQTLQQHFATQQRERGLRDALSRLGPDAKEDDVIRAITPFVGADTAFKAIESKRAREAQLANTREMAMARLAQQASQFDRKQMTAEQRLKLDEWYKKQMGEIAAGRAAYDLPPDLYQRPAAPQNSQTGVYNFGGGKSGPLQAEPTDAQAIEMWKASGAVQNPSPAGAVAAQGAPAPAEATPVATAPAEAPVAAPEQPAEAPAPAAPPPAPAAPVQGAPVARGMTPPAQGAPVARGVPQPPAELEAQWAKLGRRDADRKRADWIAKNMGNAQLDENGVKVAAWEKLLYGTDPKGLGTASAQQRAQVANERARIGRELGLSDQEMAMLPQDNKVKMKAVSGLTAWGANVAKGAEQVEKSLDVAIEYAKKIDPTQFRTLNKLILAGKAELNDPLVAGYATAIQTVAREYGRLMSGPTSNAMLPVEALKKGDELISAALNVNSLEEVKKVMLRDAKITADSVNTQINNLRSTIIAPKGDQPFLGGSNASDRSVTVGGKTYNFPTPAAAAEFKRKAGIQ